MEMGCVCLLSSFAEDMQQVSGYADKDAVKVPERDFCESLSTVVLAEPQARMTPITMQKTYFIISVANVAINFGKEMFYSQY